MTSRTRFLLLFVAACALAAAFIPHSRGARPGAGEFEADGGPYPSDWFGLQRAYPYTTIPQDRWVAAVEQGEADRAWSARALRTDAAFSTSPLTWLQAGPYNIGGRVTALASVPGANPIYLGAAAGGVFKSVNGGVNWSPMFDTHGVYSIGALALDPTSPNTVWVGTGEANSAIDNYDGAGVFRSFDGGVNWDYMGLAETARIARVAVDPANPSRVFVAAMGTQFSTGPARGVYRTEDAGASWQQVLFVNDSTGACDVAVNPAHPETVFCATWERVRRPTYRRAFGPGCGIWRSADHGTTWTRLAGGLPAPSDNVGRIGIAIAASRPSTVYAQITAGSSGGYQGLGLYRSTDAGTTWTRRDASGFTGIFGGFGWYFGDMAVDATNPDRVFCLGVSVIRSTDGGVTFTDVTSGAHVDQHAIWIDPTSPNRILLGNDGGFFSTTAGGPPWTATADLPITQFYAEAVDPRQPLSRLFGGTQDNFTLRTDGSPTAWFPVLGGDGFQVVVDPAGPDTVFCEYQNCCSGTGPQRSVTGGPSGTTPTGFVGSDRYNWCTPMVIDPSNDRVLLVGSQRVYKSTDNGRSYTPISGDLTTNPPALLTYGTITALEISPANSQVYYAGTDDARVWRSTNAGATWESISSGLPQRWVTRLTADPTNGNVVYVTLSGFGLDEHLPHVYRSTDRGTTWTSIGGGLPDAPANDIVVDPTDPQTLYLATDIGVYATRNLGAAWFPLGQGMPVQTVFDLAVHAASHTLVAATHGRSMWKLDLGELPAAAPLASAPAGLALSAPTPNPSRGVVHLTLELGAATRVEVAVYDVTGRCVRRLANGWAAAGRSPLAWDGRDERGRSAAAGVYFARARAGGAIVTRRIVRAD